MTAVFVPETDPPHSSTVLAERFGPSYRWRVLGTVMIGTVAAIMASTIINVAVPDMSRVFGLGQERAQWLSAGFMGAMTLSMLTTPWLLERYGYRHTYIGAVLLLMLGGIVGGVSPWFDLVLSARVAEGLAAGVLQPIPAIIVLHAFGAGERGKAMGIFGFGVVLAPAVGPSVGGILVEWFGWRSIFFVVTPFCLIAMAMAQRYLPIGTPGGGQVHRGGGRLDVVGLGLIAVAVLALLNGMVHLTAQTMALGLALMACSVVATVGFIYHQRRGAKPLMALGLFAHRPFSMGGLVAFIYGMALFGSTYLVPVFMQEALHLPPSQAGAVLLPAGIALALTIPMAGRLADRVAVGKLVSLGLILLAASFFLMLGVGTGTALLLITLWAVIGRIGLGFVLPSLNLGSMHGLPDVLISHGSSTINFLRQLGGALGIALVGNVLEWRLRSHSGEALQAYHETFALVGAITACAVLAALRMGAPSPRHRLANLDISSLPQRCDVLIVGAGPAGSAAAQLLARAGRDVVLIDAQPFPRDKVCGDGLIPDAHRALARLGVLERVMAEARVSSTLGCIAPRGGRIDVPGTLAVLPRKRLDEIVCEAAVAAGARMFAPVRFVMPLRDGGETGTVIGARVKHGDVEREIHASWVVLASGAQPQATIAAGVCDRRTPSGIALRGYIRSAAMAARITALEVVWHKRLSPGYGWIFPCGDDVFNIGVGVAQSHREGKDGRHAMQDVNLRDQFAAFQQVYAPARDLVASGTWLAEPGQELKGAPLRCSLEGARLDAPGLLVTGEAAGSTYAFTGEGIGKAMETGIHAAEAILASGDDRTVRADYAARVMALKPRFALYEEANRANAHPWLIDLLVWSAKRSPRRVQRMAGVLEETHIPTDAVTVRGVLRRIFDRR